jgi:antitoxin (DNA-binding transcriptional repressor) of toxin-antitoxin stability system
MKEKTLDSLREGKLNIGADGKPVAKLIAKPAPAPAKKSTSGADNKKTKKKETKQEPKKEEPEPEFASRRERRAYKRDQLGQREHQRGQGKTYHAPAPAADGNESDGGFFE